jgi:hypothetical protein
MSSSKSPLLLATVVPGVVPLVCVPSLPPPPHAASMHAMLILMAATLFRAVHTVKYLSCFFMMHPQLNTR